MPTSVNLTLAQPIHATKQQVLSSAKPVQSLLVETESEDEIVPMKKKKK
jgi:hypothetical protein